MRKAVIFDEFASQCPYFEGDTDVNNGYGCTHPKRKKYEGEEVARCYSYLCPLGIEAEQQDLTDREDPSAIKEYIDWDGLCEDGEVMEGEYLLVAAGESASEDERNALYAYEKYIHRYDKKWLDAHGIPNSLVS